MGETRKQLAQRMIRDTLGQGNGSTIEKALTEFSLMYVGDWPSLTDDILDELHFVENDTQSYLTRGQKRLLTIFRFLVEFRIQRDGLDPSYYGHDITQADFEEFRISPECRRMFLKTQPIPAPPQAKAQQTSVQVELELFRKGIKRDPALFPVLKEDSQWDSWNRSVIALARAQGVDQVLDHNFTPVNHDETALFIEKQKYMYSVFERCLQTDKGKSIVRVHETDYDAQKVYKAILDYSSSSTRALLESGDLLSYITQTRLGDGSWKNGTHKFILHWEEQVRQYEKLVPVTDHFSESIKLQMLQNAVYNIPDLRQVKVQADQLATQTGRRLTYAEYVALLSSAAAQYDKQFSNSPGTTHAKRRQVFFA